jgi:hypothetical protein
MKAMQAIQIALKFSDGGMKMLDEMKADALVRPGPWGGNHAMWIAGHLAVIEGRLHKMLHGTPNPVEHWKPLFDWGSQPRDGPDDCARTGFQRILRQRQAIRHPLLVSWR